MVIIHSTEVFCLENKVKNKVFLMRRSCKIYKYLGIILTFVETKTNDIKQKWIDFFVNKITPEMEEYNTEI